MARIVARRGRNAESGARASAGRLASAVTTPSAFRDARALVTGASSGIGAAVARRLAAAGARLVVTARRADRLESLAAECRALGAPEAHAFAGDAADLADRAAPARVAAAATERLGGVDVLVNNAGFAVPGQAERSSTERTLRMIDVNVAAPVALTRLLLPPMLERRRGWILNVASMAGIMPAPWQASYAGTKAFLLNWSESVREEVRSRGVHVTALCPGITDTEFFEAAGYRGSNRFTKSRMPADRVAKAGLSALAKGKPRVVPGAINKTLIFVGTRLSPRWLVQRVAAGLMRRRPEPDRD
jgi:short-subunit dehydrogenase